jgi:hypothetical protein
LQVCGFQGVEVKALPARLPLFQKLTWNAQADALLGVDSDRVVAKKVGVNQATVQRRREALGIPPARRGFHWDATTDALLGVESDRVVGAKLGIHPETAQRRRKALGVPAWHQPKRLYRRNCIQCGEPFEVVGRSGRKTCPPPKLCQRKQVAKMLELGGPAGLIKRTQGLRERHVLTDRD